MNKSKSIKLMDIYNDEPKTISVGSMTLFLIKSEKEENGGHVKYYTKDNTLAITFNYREHRNNWDDEEPEEKELNVRVSKLTIDPVCKSLPKVYYNQETLLVSDFKMHETIEDLLKDLKEQKDYHVSLIGSAEERMKQEIEEDQEKINLLKGFL